MEFNNRGILFRNFRKQQPKHPDLVGEATLDGRKFKVAAWKKTGKRGDFYSMAFTLDQPPEPQQQAEPLPAPQPSDAPPTDNDIPF